MDDVSMLDFVEWMFESWTFVLVFGGIVYAVAAQRRRDAILDRRLNRMELSRRLEAPGELPTVFRSHSAAGPDPASVKRGDRWDTGRGQMIWDGEQWLPYV